MINVKLPPAIIILMGISLILLLAFGVYQEDDGPDDTEGFEIQFWTEPNEPIELWPNDIYLEITLTNEPTFEEGNRIYLYQGDDFDIVIEKKEPNEPTKSYSFPTGIIPTWPDFIELKKDLYIDIVNRNEEPTDMKWYFGKGTRIYYTEDN